MGDCIDKRTYIQETVVTMRHDENPEASEKVDSATDLKEMYINQGLIIED